VSPNSVVIHMLRPVDLVGATTLEEAKEALRRRIASRFLLAWWAPVEAGFLDQLFGGGLGAWMRRAIDVRDLLLALEGEAAARLTLSAAAERHHVPVASPHEALDDALVTAQLFLVLATKLGDRTRTIRDLQSLAPKQGSHGFR
jgi:DNA polymerase-3 subunit epsilon